MAKSMFGVSNVGESLSNNKKTSQGNGNVKRSSMNKSK